VQTKPASKSESLKRLICALVDGFNHPLKGLKGIELILQGKEGPFEGFKRSINALM
jgi:hypothetical protein